MIILGINAYHGDAAASILVDGKLIAAVEEERFNRLKHSAGFPREAIIACLHEAGIGPGDIDHIVVSRDPTAQLASKVGYIIRKRPSFKKFLEARLKKMAHVYDVDGELEKLFHKGAIRAKMHRVEHHKAHVASSFFSSSFDRAAILSVDGFGDFVSTMAAVGEGKNIKILNRVVFPHSLGILYNAVTQYLGFPHYGDEGKVMGLAPYGEPVYMDIFRDMVKLGRGLNFTLNTDYFGHEAEALEDVWEEGAPVVKRIFSRKMENALGPAREPGTPIEKRHQDVAMSLQVLLEDSTIELLRRLRKKTGLSDLCLCGGVAFNSVMNGRIRRERIFDRIYIPPAAGDAGTSLGGALWVLHQTLKQPRSFVMEHAYTGTQYSQEYIEKLLQARGEQFRVLDEESLVARIASKIIGGAVVGWFQGRMEFGPRALGNRSILVDPRRAEMKDVLNSRIKHREPFRPFAPSVLAERAGEWFEVGDANPFMLMVHPVLPGQRRKVPAITHVDGSGRLQTVHRDTNRIFWELIHEFEKHTGVPMLLNTSFNENEPIVTSPEDALNCFNRTRMDLLVLGRAVLERQA